MINLAVLVVFALAFLIYMGGKIDLSYIEQEANKEMGTLKVFLRQRDKKAQSNGGEGRKISRPRVGATGRESRLVASGPPVSNHKSSQFPLKLQQ